MPMRTRSFAPRALEAASVPARPVATRPMKLRRDCMKRMLLNCPLIIPSPALPDPALPGTPAFGPFARAAAPPITLREMFRGLAALLLVTSPLVAQTATLRGRVTDESGAIVPGAIVTLRGPATRSAKVDPAGGYTLANVSPG